MPQQYVLVLNCGSSSFKFAIVDALSGIETLSGLAECLASPDAKIKYRLNGEKYSTKLAENASHDQAIQFLVKVINDNQLAEQLVGIGHRIVHGGEQFTQSVLVTPEVISAIEKVSSLAPLHNPANLTGIKAAQQAFPTLPQVAVFDTAFHQSIPEHAYLYALPKELYREHGIRRYGFHGTSHYYVSQKAAELLKLDIGNSRIVTAHLGNGCSVTAIKNGQSMDTSMGLTPLEGLVMGTRSGDLDPGLFAYLQHQLKMSGDQIDQLFNKQSGLLGLSELSNDCRAIEEAAEQGHQQAQLALEVFCYRLAKYIAGYAVPLNGLDALIFTGGIGENSSYIRARVVSSLAFMGFNMNDELNLKARFGEQGVITDNNSGPVAAVVPTNEEWVIAQDTAEIAVPSIEGES